VFTPLGLDHIVLRVQDQVTSRRFYTDVLGCTVDHVNEKISLIQLRFGAHLIDLLPATDGQGRTQPGLDHFCLSIRCDDLAKVAEALKARGVALAGGVVERRGAFGTGPSIYITDPDGYMIELKPRRPGPLSSPAEADVSPSL
jgi:glyoxylase I family protein